MIFNVQTIVRNQPQLSVVNADSSTIPITYPQIKQSLGNDIYNVESFYIYSSNPTQLSGQIQYNRFDSSGRQALKSIITTIDPYNLAVSVVQKVDQAGTLFILNGNSSFSTTILPNTNAQIKFFSKRVSSSFIRPFHNFEILERIFKLGGFSNEQPKRLQKPTEEVKETKDFEKIKDFELLRKKEDKFNHIYVNGLVALSAGFIAYLIIKLSVNDRKH